MSSAGAQKNPTREIAGKSSQRLAVDEEGGWMVCLPESGRMRRKSGRTEAVAAFRVSSGFGGART